MNTTLNFKQIISLRNDLSTTQKLWTTILYGEPATCQHYNGRGKDYNFLEGDISKCGRCGKNFNMTWGTVIQGSIMPMWKYLATLYTIHFFRAEIDMKELLKDLRYKGDYIHRRRKHIDETLPENANPLPLPDITINKAVMDWENDVVAKYEAGAVDLSLFLKAILEKSKKNEPGFTIPF